MLLTTTGVLVTLFSLSHAEIGTAPFPECSEAPLKWSSALSAPGLEIENRVLYTPQPPEAWVSNTLTTGYNSGVHYWTITVLKPGSTYCGVRQAHSPASYSGGFTWKAPYASTDDAGWTPAPGNRALDQRGEVIGFELDVPGGVFSVYDHQNSELMGSWTSASLQAGAWFPFCAMRYSGAISLHGPFPRQYQPPAPFSALWDEATAPADATVSSDGRSVTHAGGSWDGIVSNTSFCRGEWFWAVKIVAPASSNTYCGVRRDAPPANSYSGAGSFVYKLPYGQTDSPGFTPTKHTAGGFHVAGSVVGFLLDADFGTLKVIDMATFQSLGQFEHTDLSTSQALHPYCSTRTNGGTVELIGPYPSAMCGSLPDITGLDEDKATCTQHPTRGFECSYGCTKDHGFTSIEFPGFSADSAVGTCGALGWTLDPDGVAYDGLESATCKLHHAATDPLGLTLADESQEIVFGDDADVSLFRRGSNLLTNADLYVKGVNLLEVIADLQSQLSALQKADSGQPAALLGDSS